MADQPVTITREKYEALVAYLSPRLNAQNMADLTVAAALCAAGIEIERTAEERIAAFVTALKASYGPDMPSLPDLIHEHFPEVRRG